MIKINLLPFRAQKKKENVKNQILTFIFFMILLFAALFFTNRHLNANLDVAQTEKQEVQKKYDSMKKTIDEIAAFEKVIKDLKGKVDSIMALETKKTGPVQLFDSIAMAVPKGKCFLNGISESSGVVSMGGTARDYDTVAQFMTNLQALKLIKTVELGGVTQSGAGEETTANFTLTCTTIHKKETKKKGKKRRRRRR